MDYTIPIDQTFHLPGSKSETIPQCLEKEERKDRGERRDKRRVRRNRERRGERGKRGKRHRVGMPR